MFLQLQGQDSQTVAALRRGDIDSAALPENERELLRFASLLTRHAYRCTDADTDRLRQAGWSDPQIAEAVYITAMFAFFNRVADAFGLEDPQYQTLAGGPPQPAPRPWQSADLPDNRES
ncbi:MAG: hypothetical protein EHM42_12565 [Planctomycetaceae bacterium]|nr:MAG: hypothetical protein EHM42_12565 [Planctomycetaceae bacterium]